MSPIKYSLLIAAFLNFNFQNLNAQNSENEKNLINNLFQFAKTSAVTGRESQASEYIKNLLPDANIQTDKLGNIILTIGSGEPRRLITAPLDEPGYVISSIQEDGYLRINRLGGGYIGNLFHQFIQGHDVTIGTEGGPVPAVSTVRSMHYERLRATPETQKPVFSWREAFIDVGESSAEGVAKKGIKLLDPITLSKKPTLINNHFIAAPAVRAKAAALSLAVLAKHLSKKDIKGTVVIAWNTLELLNGKGLEAIINNYGPFKNIYRFNRLLDSDQIDQNHLLTTGTSSGERTDFISVAPVVTFPDMASTINYEKLNLTEVGLPAKYPHTPVEMISISDFKHLISFWYDVLDVDKKKYDLPQATIKENNTSYTTFKEQHDLISKLISTYGVSYDEGRVRDLIFSELPKWAKPEVDDKGNIRVTFGKGQEHLAFIAHMDETGYVVDAVNDDGTLVLKNRGGMLPWVWEAEPAVIHLDKKDLPGIFEPRKDYENATKRMISSPLTVYAGFSSKKEALASGIIPMKTTVTMPKAMIRLNENRAVARGFDDRVGCASLLYSLGSIDPDQLHKKITFIWATGEEVGLIGSTFASKDLKDFNTVYPVDTFVSSDDPYTDEFFANCPIGEGAVIRVLESINFVNRENLEHLQTLAADKNVEVQYGMTAGGTDGQAFLGYGIPSVPLSWPGRYSHSPVELMDYRDMDNLVSLINAIIYE